MQLAIQHNKQPWFNIDEVDLGLQVESRSKDAILSALMVEDICECAETLEEQTMLSLLRLGDIH